MRATARAAPAKYPHGERWLGKARRRTGTAPAAIFANSGPSGPAGIQTNHSNFARRKFCTISQACVPRNGGPGADSPCQGEMSRSDREGREREYERGALILSHPPGGSLVTFWPARKSLAARRRRNTPEPISKGEDPLWQPKPS